MFTINNIIYNIGSFGPLILILLSTFILYSKPKYLVVFFVGSIVNTLINYMLKGLFGQPRPNDDSVNLEKKYRSIYNFNRYGMPSGHVQSAFFSLVFVFLVTQNISFCVGYFVLTLVITYQRVQYNFHYLSQTIVGAMVGSIIAFLFFNYGLGLHKGKLEFKKDDLYFGMGSV